MPISIGQVNQILLKYVDGFEAGKEILLEVGLQVSPHVHVDDTGARHRRKTGVCTHIGNAWFAYFSEQDIREYTLRRKISGSTRSDRGRRCRDTFASLKKTCRKHGISFWRYLIDRRCGSHTIPNLADLIAQRAAEVSM